MGHHIKVVWFLISLLDTNQSYIIEDTASSRADCYLKLAERNRVLTAENPDAKQMMLFCRPSWADDAGIPILNTLF